MRLWYTLVVLALYWGPIDAQACHGPPSTFTITNGLNIEARAQSGVRLQGRASTPRVTAVRQIGGSRLVSLRGTTTVTDTLDTRPIWQRMFGGAPELEDIRAENQVLLQPGEVLDTDINYEISVQDGEHRSTLYIRFIGGTQKC